MVLNTLHMISNIVKYWSSCRRTINDMCKIISIYFNLSHFSLFFLFGRLFFMVPYFLVPCIPTTETKLNIYSNQKGDLDHHRFRPGIFFQVLHSKGGREKKIEGFIFPQFTEFNWLCQLDRTMFMQKVVTFKLKLYFQLETLISLFLKISN